MKFDNIVSKIRAGSVTDSDLAGVSVDDIAAIRQDLAGGSRRQFNVGSVDEAISELFATGKQSEADGIEYVMVSDQPIPPFNDVIPADAWDLREFRQRGSVLLYGHNSEMSRPPIGKMKDVRKGCEVKRGTKQFKALCGRAQFVPEGFYEFADLVRTLVAEGYLRGGSVGFDITEARPPKDEDEAKELGIKPYSLIITGARLVEFSVVPLGRDPNAVTMSRDGKPTSLLGRIEEFARAGVADVDVVAALRADVLSRAGAPETGTAFFLPPGSRSAAPAADGNAAPAAPAAPVELQGGSEQGPTLAQVLAETRAMAQTLGRLVAALAADGDGPDGSEGGADPAPGAEKTAESACTASDFYEQLFSESGDDTDGDEPEDDGDDTEDGGASFEDEFISAFVGQPG